MGEWDGGGGWMSAWVGATGVKKGATCLETEPDQFSDGTKIIKY